MGKIYRILTINPGSTSTKIGVFDNESMVCEHTMRHSTDELAGFNDIASQYEFRKEAVLAALSEAGIDLFTINAVIGRGGLIKPIPSGIYKINENMESDLRSGRYGEHASNLGGLIAAELGRQISIPAFIADPVVVDELLPVARLTGLPSIERRSIFHALNQKAIARRYCEDQGKRYEDINLIVAHLGGGISVGAHREGQVVDVNNALDGDGPFSPERAGTIPAGQLVSLCYESGKDKNALRKMITGQGGVVAHCGTNNIGELIQWSETDQKAKLVLDSMCYNIAKQIGTMAAVLCGEVDAVILTGGIAYNNYVCDYIEKMVRFIAPVAVYAGEDELQALAFNALLVLNGQVPCSDY